MIILEFSRLAYIISEGISSSVWKLVTSYLGLYHVLCEWKKVHALFFSGYMPCSGWTTTNLWLFEWLFQFVSIAYVQSIISKSFFMKTLNSLRRFCPVETLFNWTLDPFPTTLGPFLFPLPRPNLVSTQLSFF